MNVYSEPSDNPATPLDAVCVFCGSSGRVAERHRKAASRFGQILGENGITLVFGGGRVGLMGLCADAAVAAGGKAVGVIPRILHEVEVAHQNLTELHIVETMHERKKLMFDRSDAFVVLPGGVGTLDETFEIITWRQLRLHDKPIIVVDEGGYWAPFVSMVDHIVASGFAGERTRQLFQVVKSVEDVLPALAASPAPKLAAHPEKL
ncbi:TIGR00730 family Rossman fold protein [Desertibaculum subflavum]|uniref:LOG family protein n=1 Tax=Desertibaculum subflavum TaxID=2268458 RepID=UPI000E662D81